MSAPHCTVCNDTGSRDKSGDYLDCGHCDAAMQRKAMNDFLDKLPAMGDYDAAWLVHQRALAMAPKQEAPQPAPEIRTVLRDSLASGLTLAYGCSRVWSAWSVGTMSQDDFYPASECDDLLDELCDLAIAALRPDLAAPAAANGTMPELPEIQMDHLNVLAQHYTADQMRAYGQTCHAMGRGAAVHEYIESGTFKQPAPANGALTDEQIIQIITDAKIHCVHPSAATTLDIARTILAAAGPDAALVKALEDITAIEDKMVGSDWEEIDEARTIARSALSGAKGN